MQRIGTLIRISLLTLLLSSGLALGLRAEAGAAERINLFDSRIVVHADASMTVTETITVTSTGEEIRRGIVREFPTRYRDRYGNAVRVGFDLVEIRRDGRPEPYHTEKAGNGVKIYIGQKDVLLQPGRHTFTITYKTDRQLGFFNDYDELYWNVTGTGWSFPIEAAKAVVELPPGAKISQYAAYTGPFGAQGQDFRVSYDRTGNIVFTTTRGLGVREGLTIAVAWPKGIVREPTASEGAVSYLRDNGPLLGGGLGFLGLLLYYLRVWFRVGRDPARGTIIPLFEPPKGFSPAAVRYLMQMGFDARTLATSVLDMAVKGFLRIREKDGEYILEKRGDPQLFPEETELGRGLFVGNKTLEIGAKNQSRLAGAQTDLEKSLKLTLANVYFKTNYKFIWPALLITALLLGALIITAEDTGAAAGILLFYVITGGMIAIFAANWQKQGWFIRIFFVIFGSFWFFFTAILGPASIFSSYIVPGILGGIIVLHLLFVKLLKAPTVQGRQIMDQIEGFKMYLSVAEKDRLEKLHPPEKTPELFEKYLPYAFALDVENEWSEQFADVLAQASVAGQEYTPSWYSGSSWNSQRFSGFTSELGSSLASSIASAATPPSSSSGSGGGGSSGGGGGGGGGGGW